jgi:hypothetical protein
MNTGNFKITEFPLKAYCVRFLLISWIVFALMKFEVNTIFFGVTIGIALVILFFIGTKSIQTKAECIEFKETFFLPFMNVIERIEYKDILDVRYVIPETNGVTIMLNVINYVPSTIHKKPILLFTLREGVLKEIETMGNDTKNVKFVELIHEKIRMNNN